VLVALHYLSTALLNPFARILDDEIKPASFFNVIFNEATVHDVVTTSGLSTDPGYVSSSLWTGKSY
jgi:hypothetical protein